MRYVLLFISLFLGGACLLLLYGGPAASQIPRHAALAATEMVKEALPLHTALPPDDSCAVPRRLADCRRKAEAGTNTSGVAYDLHTLRWGTHGRSYTATLPGGSSLRPSALDVRKCLRQGGGLVFLGDSVLRYLYLSLVLTLHSQDGATPPSPEASPNHPLLGASFATWNDFFRSVNRKLEGTETCECDRNYTYNLENRWYEEGCMSVAFFAWMGGDHGPRSRRGCREAPSRTHGIQAFIRERIAVHRPKWVVVHAGIHPWNPIIQNDRKALSGWIDALQEAVRAAKGHVILWSTVSLSQPSHHVRPGQVLNPMRIADLIKERANVHWFDARWVTSKLVAYFKSLSKRDKRVLGNPYVDKVHWTPRVVNEIQRVFMQWLCANFPD